MSLVSSNLNHGWVYRDRISAKHAGKTVLDYYSNQYRHSTPQQWRTRIQQGQILIEAEPTTPDTVLALGEQLTYHRSPWQEPAVPLEFATIYQDRDLLVINKPSGLPVLPGGNFLEHTLLKQLEKLYPKNPPIPIHRLGRGTSGLMLLARSLEAKSRLSRQMRDRKITKIYLAKASGIIQQEKFIITQPIGKIPHPAMGYIYGATDSGKYAHSECQVLQRGADHTLVKVKILTGRPHQIRIHLAAAGYPLVGDPLYLVGGIPRTQKIKNGTYATPSDLGYWLHAHCLEFQHPSSNQKISFTRLPPN